MIRPEALATLSRWRESGFAVALGLFGLWLAGRGGWVFGPLGLALAAAGTAFLILALRRARFRQNSIGPGLVELDESQITYFGPTGGGAVSLRELVELRLLARGGRRFWRLKQADGQALLVPVDATGADRLFDAFSALPGMDSHTLVAALAPIGGAASGGLPASATDTLGPVIWHRPARRALT